MDDDEDDDEDQQQQLTHTQQTQQHHHHYSHHHNHHFDDDDDDEKSPPSPATAAIIKVEPNLYSSGSGDNSNDMFIKAEVMFEDSAALHSPQSPPSSKFSISNFDSDLVDHHVDLNHSLPSYGNLFEPHSIPVSYIRMMTMTSGWIIVRSVDCTTQRRRRPPMGTSSRRNGYSSYAMNGKFDDHSDALCDAANFIYN